MSFAWAILVACSDVPERVPVDPTTPTEPTPTSPTTPEPEPTEPTEPTSCADPAQAVGAGSATLSVTEDAVYCILGVDTWEGLARKRRVTFTPGSYAWPAASDEGGDHRVPTCVEDGEETYGTAVGTVSLTEYPFPWIASETRLVLPLDNGQDLVLRAEKTGDTPPVDTALDGRSTHKVSGGAEYVSLQLCESDDTCESIIACRTPRLGDESDVLTFARGELVLYLDITDDGGVWIDPPRVLYRATGTIDGVGFEQDDEFQLGYAYAAHGLDRTLVVRFEEPVAGGCGLIGTYGRDEEEFLSLVDCDGKAIAELGPLDLEP